MLSGITLKSSVDDACKKNVNSEVTSQYSGECHSPESVIELRSPLPVDCAIIIFSEIPAKRSMVSRKKDTIAATPTATITSTVNLRESAIICVHNAGSDDFPNALPLNMMTTSDSRSAKQKGDVTRDVSTKTKSVGKHRLMTSKKLTSAKKNAMKKRAGKCPEMRQPASEDVDSAGSNDAKRINTVECREAEWVTENGKIICSYLNGTFVAGNITASKVQKYSTENAVGKTTVGRSITINTTFVEWNDSRSFDQYPCSGHMEEDESVKGAEKDDSVAVSVVNRTVGCSVGSAYEGARSKEGKDPKLTKQCAEPFGYYHYDQYSAEGVKGKKGPLYRGPLASKMTKRKFLSAHQETATDLNKLCANKTTTSQKTLPAVKSVQKCVEKQDSTREVKSEVKCDVFCKKEYSGNKKYNGKNASRAAKARHENQVYLTCTKDAERHRKD